MGRTDFAEKNIFRGGDSINGFFIVRSRNVWLCCMPPLQRVAQLACIGAPLINESKNVYRH